MTRPADIPAEIFERADILCDQFRHYDDDREFVARILMHLEKDAAVGLTERQSCVLKFVKSYSAEHGFAPSYTDIGIGCSIPHRSRVHAVVGQLQARGLIRRIPGRARSICVIHGSNVSTAHKNSVEA